MHILLTTAFFPPETGSAAHLFFDLGRALRARGHRVSVLTAFPTYHPQGDTSRYRGRVWMREDRSGLEVHRIAVPQVGRNRPIGRGLWQVTCAPCFGLAALRIPRVDVALAYSPPLPLGLALLFHRLVRKVPCVVNVQDLFPQSAVDLGVLRQPALIRAFERMERCVYGRADAVTVHSAGNRAHVLSRGGRSDRTVILPNAVNIDEILPGPKENALRARHGLRGRFIVSFAGVMGYSQDLDVILEAADRLRDIPAIHFLLVGDGNDKARGMTRSQELGLPNITWLPMQPREAYPEVLHASDLGLATLRASVKTPVVPSKIISLMAAGVPVAACLNAEGDAPRLIAEAGAGVCVPAGDPHALAGAIRRLWTDQGQRERMGVQGRRYVERHLSCAAVAERYERLFHEVRS